MQPGQLKPVPRLRRSRNRTIWTFGLLLAALVAGWAGVKYYMRPARVVVAVSQDDADNVKVLNAYQRVMSSGRIGVTLEVTPMQTRKEVVSAFLARKADLAVVRADDDLHGEAAAVAIMRKAIAVVVSFDPKIDELEKIKGKRLGLVGVGGSSDPLLTAFLRAYDIAERDVQVVRIAPDKILEAIEQKRVDVAMGLTTLFNGSYGAQFRALVKSRKLKPKLLAIDSSEEMVRDNPAFEEFEIPKDSFAAMPEEATESVSLATYLVAQSRMSNEVAATLARQFLSNKQAVLAAAPSAAQIEAPSVEKDALLRVHPGVGAYIDNTELTFFDRYGDLMYIGMAITGVFGSAFVALRRSFGPDTEGEACDLVEEFGELRRSIRQIAIAGRDDPDELPDRWIAASHQFEEMLSRALPLIANSHVQDRTVQALGAALSTTERALAEIAPLALRRGKGEGAAQAPPNPIAPQA